MEKLSARRALGWMAALTLLFSLAVLVYGLTFLPREGQRITGRSAAPEAVLTGRDQNAVALEMLPGERINLNTASEADLKKLPGIGDGLAAAIVAYREANGPFGEIEELMEVPGIGKGRFAAVEDLITVE